MSVLDEIRIGVGSDQIVLVVLTSVQLGQIQAELEKLGLLVSDPKVTRNALWGVPFEVNDLWVGAPGLLTADDVVKYRQARRSLDMRMNPARRLEL